MVGYTSTDLGDQATAKRLITQDISSLNYQQPFQQLGTHALPQPVGNATIPYVAGFNKYVLYISAPASGAVGGINTTLTKTGAPIILSGSSTVSGSCEYIVSGLAPVIGPVLPEYTTITKILNNTTTLLSEVQLLMYGILTLPTYTGTAVLKLVLNFNLD
jgi:hypothetical protein